MECLHDWVSGKTCLYKNTSCNPNTCLFKYLFERQIELSNIPKGVLFHKALYPEICDTSVTVDLQSIQRNITEFVKNGYNLYLWSDYFGNGKTTWSVDLLLQYIFDNIYRIGYNTTVCKFVRVPELLIDMKAFTNQDSEYFQKINTLKNCDVVVWDDLGASNLSNYDHSTLFSLLECRLSQGLSNIYTGNLDERGLERAIGQRLCSRIWNGSKVLEFRGRDRRNNKEAEIK